MKTKLLSALLLVLAPACGASEPPAPAAPSPEEALAALKADAAAFQAKAEHHDAEVTIQHCLVGVQGRGTKAMRSAAEAEAFAAEVYARVRAGEDFDLLVKNHSDDQYPSTYILTLAAPAPAGAWARRQMVPAFGDAAWRLAVGEIGIAPFDGDAPEPKSPFGWHIVKRLK